MPDLPIRRSARASADLGATPFPHAPAEFGAYVAAETEKWGKVVRSAGVKAE